VYVGKDEYMINGAMTNEIADSRASEMIQKAAESHQG
jgi:hypothetical protein